ncbi:MAG: prepilin peptidase [Haloechinothrix sp.]
MLWGILMVSVVMGCAVGAAGRLVLARLRRGARIPGGWCELAAACACAVIGVRWLTHGFPPWWLPVPVALTALGIPLAAIDLARRRLPDALTIPAYALFAGALLAASTVGANGGVLLRAVIGVGVFGGAHLMIHLAAPASLGAGDVKLSGSLGGILAAVGWPAMVVAAGLAAVLTLVLAAVPAALRAGAWTQGVPHGPGLLAATWLVAVFPGAGLLG